MAWGQVLNPQFSHGLTPTHDTAIRWGQTVQKLVSVNARSLGPLWKPPYRVDVTDALQAGRNEIAIKVTNQWTNRLSGDRIVPAG